MAEQDFANVEAMQSVVIRPITPAKRVMFVSLLIGLVLLSFVAGWWLGHENGLKDASTDDQLRLQKTLREQRAELVKLRIQAKEKQPAEVSTTQVGDLTFYNELPKQAVEPVPLDDTGEEKDLKKTIEPEANALPLHAASDSAAMLNKIITQELQESLKRKEKAAQIEKKVAAQSKQQHTVYMLQVASYQSEAEAKKFAPKLQKQGFETQIKRVKLAKLGVWYRVYVGPFKRMEDAKKARGKVKKNMHITGLVVKNG